MVPRSFIAESLYDTGKTALTAAWENIVNDAD
jgi:hypothetical protein